jgi:hypothetical protein
MPMNAESSESSMSRLETAIGELKADLAQSREVLLEQFEMTRLRLEAGAELAQLHQRVGEVLRERDEANSSLQAVRHELEELRHDLDPSGGLERLRQVEQERDEAREEAAALREALTALRHTMTRLMSLHGAHIPGPGEEEALSQEDSPPSPDALAALRMDIIDAGGRRLRMGEMLCVAGLISTEQLEDALRVQDEEPQRRLGNILVERGYTGEDTIAHVLASQLALPFVKLERQAVDEKAVTLLPARLARLHNCFAYASTPEKILLAMSNPLDLVAIDEVSQVTGLRVVVVVATRGAIERAIEKHHGADAGDQG